MIGFGVVSVLDAAAPPFAKKPRFYPEPPANLSPTFSRNLDPSDAAVGGRACEERPVTRIPACGR